MAPTDPKKLFDPELNKNKSEFDQSIFIRKPCELYSTYT